MITCEKRLLAEINWKDKDLKNVETINNIDAVCIVVKIDPPLSQDEIDVLAKGPKF